MHNIICTGIKKKLIWNTLIDHSPNGALQGQWKEMMIMQNNEHNTVKNHSWQEADQLAI